MWIELIVCYFATVAFGVIFNGPTRIIWIGGFIGVSSWFIYSLAPVYTDASFVFATAVASLVAATLSHVFAKWFRVPVTNFSIQGIIPLVPGSKAYFTMRAFLDGEYIEGIELGIDTLLQAGAIAGGLVFALAIFSFGKGGIGQRYEEKRS
ncbi:threonine/serine exporter family protein [Alkalihalobacillus trypoxylicola]|uniref:Threonine/Serine exporter ThrE domain-containing protein n=1 Tax=Alkalihalobacillus trypoxylicola TaxID=519424 RepID=A0A162ENA6_9BACI|nr:threonine/serine exporter family protein [Alkalihalobacillus trypoxylicola]KYG33316.1 hypothetical protein AZF04_17270 [Alkalihalobacillus trypoxylicola]